MGSIETMSETEMRNRIKEIDVIRFNLNKEREEYYIYLCQKQLEKEREEKKQMIGKCFKFPSSFPIFHYEYVQAIKVLSVEEQYANSAVCLALIKKEGENYIGVQVIDIGLWSDAYNRLKNIETTPKIYNLLKEISAEEFDRLLENRLEELKHINLKPNEEER